MSMAEQFVSSDKERFNHWQVKCLGHVQAQQAGENQSELCEVLC